MSETEARRRAVDRYGFLNDAQSRRAHQIELIARIQRIASEARVVSMNARIVAARAGDHGREFAVVAERLTDISAEIETLSRSAAGMG